MASSIIIIAFLGGVIPALFWLFFWLLEDRCEPEPKRYIFFCFLLGGIMVFPVFYTELFIKSFTGGALMLFLWAATEEIVKFLAAYVIALRSRVFDEPLDAVVYLVTAALGFSAIENMLFLLTPLESGDVLRTIITGNLRFIGATLLHTLSSATIGIAIALAYYNRGSIRLLAAVGGVILAVALHTLFNFFILMPGGSATFWVFLFIWFGIIAALLLVERVKQPVRDYC